MSTLEAMDVFQAATFATAVKEAGLRFRVFNEHQKYLDHFIAKGLIKHVTRFPRPKEPLRVYQLYHEYPLTELGQAAIELSKI